MREQECYTQSPVAYAEDKAAYGTERAIREIPHNTRNAYQTAKVSAKKTEQAIRKAKQTIKNTEKATKETAKAIVNVVKATFTVTKSLIAMIIAGGWVAVFILLIVVLFGAWFAIVGSDESEQTEVEQILWEVLRVSTMSDIQEHQMKSWSRSILSIVEF